MLVRLMWDQRETSVKRLTQLTGIKYDDVNSVLSHLGFLRYYRGEFQAWVSDDVLEEYVNKLPEPKVTIDPSKIQWTPPPPPKKRDLWKARAERDG